MSRRRRRGIMIAGALGVLAVAVGLVAAALDALAAAALFRTARVGNRLRFSWQRHSTLSALLDPLPALIPRWSISMRVMS